MEDHTYELYLHHENYDHTKDKKERENGKTLADSSSECKDIKKKPFRLTGWRWLALILMNLILIGYFAVFDSPQPLETAIKATLLVNDQEYSYLYSFFAVPNIILPLIAGYIVDVVGVRSSMVVFALLVVIGQGILTYGAQLLSFNMMIAGRVVYSLGADPLNIAQMVMVNRWFKGKELALALSLATLMAGGGKAFNSVIIPVIYDATGNLVEPFGFGTLLCIFSFVCVVVMVIWDKVNEDRELALDPEYLRHAEQHAETAHISDVKKFKPIVWLLVFNFGIFDGLIFTLRSFLNDFYHVLYGYSTIKAGNYISIHYLVMAAASPLMGKVIDRVGFRASTIFYNSFLLLIGFLFYVMVPSCDQCSSPIIPLIILGVCIGIDDAAVFAALPLVLEEKYLGTGYGFYFVAENLMLTALPPVAGAIKGSFTDEVTGYSWMTIFLLIFSAIAILESLALFIVDRRQGRVLDNTVFHKEFESPKKIEDGNKKKEDADSDYVQMAY